MRGVCLHSLFQTSRDLWFASNSIVFNKALQLYPWFLPCQKFVPIGGLCSESRTRYYRWLVRIQNQSSRSLLCCGICRNTRSFV